MGIKGSNVYMFRIWNSLMVCMLTFLCAGVGSVFAMDAHTWSDDEIATLETLWIGSLPPLAVDPSNKYSDNRQAAELGKKLFFDTRFSGNNKVSCATCHREDYNFSDNLPLAHGMGTTDRRSMPIIGMAYNSWFFWDGRKDSLWSQALGPFESAVEHGFSRTMSAFVICEFYEDEYGAVFGSLDKINKQSWPQNARPAADDPSALKAWVLMDEETRDEVNRIYANMGKAIAAYGRTILPTPSAFDRYVKALIQGKDRLVRKALTDDEARGLRLFIGKAKCINCHNGPMFTNSDFHNLGVPDVKKGGADVGRMSAISQVLADEFNCLSRYSDAKPSECLELRFIDTDNEKYKGAFKTPTLRNVAERPPYMHAGQFSNLKELLEFYRSQADNPELGHGGLTDRELEQLEAFLKTLSSPLKSL